MKSLQYAILVILLLSLVLGCATTDSSYVKSLQGEYGIKDMSMTSAELGQMWRDSYR
jgi:hypothetical protein